MAGTVSTPNVGQTQYYSTTVNGQPNYVANTYDGNDPYGYTPISQQDYIAGLTSQGNTAEATKVTAGQGIYAPGYSAAVTKGPQTANNTAGVYSSASAANPSQNEQAYDQSLTGNVGAGKQPTEIAPGLANPSFGDAAANLNTASGPTAASGASISPYESAFNTTNNNGTTSPTSTGAGSALVAGTVNSATPPATSPAVSNFFNTNGVFTGTIDQLEALLQPATTTATLNQYLSQLATDQSNLQGLNTQLMNNQNIISGTSDDIRAEVTAANGFATESQVNALATARNKTLIQTDTQLTSLIKSATDAVNNDTTLSNDERTQANTEFTQNMGMLTYLQKNAEDMATATNDTYKTLMTSDPAGLYNSLLGDPTKAAAFTASTGVTMDELQSMGNPPGYNTYKQDALANGQTPLNPTDWTTQQTNTANKQKESLAYGTAFATQAGKEAAAANNPINNIQVSVTSSNGITSGMSFNVPSSLSPYIQFAANGVKYVDLSKLSATDYATMAQVAAQAGIKVIGNAAQAQTVAATTDAMNNLSTIKDAFDGVNNMTATQRDLYGAALNTVSKELQSNPNMVATDAYQAAALSVLKGITGVGGGMRGGVGLAAISNSLPKVTNSQAVNDQLIANLQGLVTNQLKTQVGVPSASDQSLIDENTAKNTISTYADQGTTQQNTVNGYAAALQATLGRMPTSQELLQAYPELGTISSGNSNSGSGEFSNPNVFSQ